MVRCFSLFKLAFEEGCNLPFDQVLASSEFQSVLDDVLTEYGSFLGKNGQRLFDAGVFKAARVCQDFIRTDDFDDDMLKTCKIKDPRRLLEERALIKLLGAKLVETAGRKLPEEITAFAGKFQKKEERNRKIKVLIELFRQLGKLGDNYPDEPEVDIDPPLTWKQLIEIDYNLDNSLPAKVETFGTGNEMPSCLCFAMMLTAWAKLANCNVILASMLQHPEKQSLALDEKISRKLKSDLDQRQISLPENRYRHFVTSIECAEAGRDYCIDYHPAIAIEVSDMAWFYLDPYLEFFGYLRPEWKIPNVALMIKKAGVFQPGLALSSNDGGILAGWQANLLDYVQNLIDSSRRLEEELKGKTFSATSFAFFLRQNAEINILAKGLEDIGIKRSMMLNIILTLGDSPKMLAAADRADIRKKFRKNRAYQAECINFLLGLYHRVGISYYYQQAQLLRIDFQYLPTCMEFGNPEFQLALQCLNNINCWGKEKSDEFSEFILSHTSSQLLWHDAMLVRLDKPSKEQDNLIRDSSKCVAELPDHHQYCTQLINQLERGNANGTEKERRGQRARNQDRKCHRGTAGDRADRNQAAR
ncbi:MAG: hypothetical protein NTW50_05055 [Candidatus Berkelbacteria bacterium]|nr:hypothetical protein [Candidatus Berkelbacteria bacterium]